MAKLVNDKFHNYTLAEKSQTLQTREGIFDPMAYYQQIAKQKKSIVDMLAKSDEEIE
jgi:hypothetical protein